jgi:hypothetical protein
VRKISTDGLVRTIAGTGEKFDPWVHANNGDGGPADKAYLSGPTSVSVDRDGNLYIADGNRILKKYRDTIPIFRKQLVWCPCICGRAGL